MSKALKSHREGLDIGSEAGFLSRRSHVQIVPGAPKTAGDELDSVANPERLSHGCRKVRPPIPAENAEIRHLALRTGELVAVDADSLDDLSRFVWCLGHQGYPLRHLPRNGSPKKKKEFLHRYLTKAEKGQIVDHVDGNPFNATRANLRVTNARGNSRNVVNSKRHKRGQFKGVYFIKKSRRWGAAIRAGELRPNGKAKQIHLGCFDTPAEAALAYDYAALKAWGEFAALNFPENNLAAIAHKLDLLPDERVSEESVAKKLAAMLASDSTGGAS